MFSKLKEYLARRKAQKEWKEEMHDILKGNNFAELASLGQIAVGIIYEASILITATTFAIVREKYKIEMEPYTAQVLASQVTNYLAGTSVEQAYQRSDEPLKSVIGKIKDMVPDKAIEIMDNDSEVREMIIRNLQFIKHIDWVFNGTKEIYSSFLEAQADYLINTYGDGISYDLDHEKFALLAKNFRIKRLKP
jgi:hypothetical protein